MINRESLGGLPFHIMTVYIPRENIFILEEWLAWHTMMGVDKFFLYDNTGSNHLFNGHSIVTDGKNMRGENVSELTAHLSDAYIERLEAEIFSKYNVEKVRWAPIEDGKIMYQQHIAFAHYVENLQENTWTAFTDVDEFIMGDIKLDVNISSYWMYGRAFRRWLPYTKVSNLVDVVDLTTMFSGKIPHLSWIYTCPKSIVQTKDFIPGTEIHYIDVKGKTQEEVEFYFNHYSYGESKHIEFIYRCEQDIPLFRPFSFEQAFNEKDDRLQKIAHERINYENFTPIPQGRSHDSLEGNNAMRILMVGPTLLALKRPLDWALAQGHEVWLIGDTNPYLIKQPPNYHFIEFVTARCKYDSISNSSIDTPIDELSANVDQLKQIAATFQPDIIHVHAINNITHCCVLAKLHPLVVSAWGFLNQLIQEPIENPSTESQIPDSNNSTEAPSLQEFCDQVLSNFDVLIVDNPALADACQGLLSSTQRIENIGLGTDTQHFHPNYASNVAKWRQVLKIPDNATVFFSPRGWGWCYGQEDIFQAFAKVYADLPQPAILLFVKLPRDTREFIEKLEEEILTQAKTLGIIDSLRWLPALPYEMLPTAYNLADVVINYPFTDAFPSTLVEAAACQRPVITSDLQAYRGTFVEEYYTLVEPNNAEALAKAMLEVVKESPVERISRLEKLRQHIVENYDEKVMRQKLMILYQELASP